MNQDFALRATPANARRLLLLRKICNLKVAPEVEQLAMQNCLDDRAFDPVVCPAEPIKLTISQFLLDCDLRGVVQADYHPEITPVVLLNVIRHARPHQSVIVTERRKPWLDAIKVWGLSTEVVASWTRLNNIDRRTVVIYDSFKVGAALRNVMREFPHFIVYDAQCGFDQLTHWTLWARLLFPSMPHPLYARLLVDVPVEWQQQPLVAFAHYYNVCIFPQFITIPEIVAALGDASIRSIVGRSPQMRHD